MAITDLARAGTSKVGLHFEYDCTRFDDRVELTVERNKTPFKTSMCCLTHSLTFCTSLRDHFQYLGMLNRRKPSQRSALERLQPGTVVTYLCPVRFKPCEGGKM